MELPPNIKEQIVGIQGLLRPRGVSVEDLTKHQKEFHEKGISVSGKVSSVVSEDVVDERLVRGVMFYANIPISSSNTLFFLEGARGGRVLVQYPSDLDVSSGDDRATRWL